MKAAEITDAMIAALQSGQVPQRCAATTPTATWSATPATSARDDGVEAVDLALARLLPVIDALGGRGADHRRPRQRRRDVRARQEDEATGAEPDGSFKAKTAHTLNPVPLILYDNVSGGKLGLKQTDTAGLSNIAATVANLLGLQKHDKWDDSLLISQGFKDAVQVRVFARFSRHIRHFRLNQTACAQKFKGAGPRLGHVSRCAIGSR
jgi:2,3-bisphosphoglycerate-independent phosphoglycerate mutase